MHLPDIDLNPPRRSTLWTGVAVFVASLLVLALAMNRVLGAYDEGLMLYGASRVLRGDVPYRDFWSMYGPGSFYLLAALFQAFGESVWVARGFDTVCRASIVVLVFALTRVEGGLRGALSTAFVVLGLLIIAPGYEFPVYPAVACALLALLCCSRGLNPTPRWQPWMAAGFAVGLAVNFRHDSGAYAALVCLYVLFMSRRVPGHGPAQRRQHLAAGAAGFALGIGPTLVWLLIEVPPADLVYNLVHVPLKVYAANRHLPLPSVPAMWSEVMAQHSPKPLLALLFYAPLLISLGAGGFALRHRLATPANEVVLEAMVLLALLFCVKAAIRVELMHLMPALVLAVLPAAITAFRSRSRALGTLLMSAAFAIVAVRLVATAEERDRSGRTSITEPNRAISGTALARWAGCTPAVVPQLRCFRIDADRAAVLHYLSRHAVPGRPIYVGAGRHDKLYVNNVELYFLSGLPAATKWHDLHPGVQTTREVQVRMLAEMQARPPQFIVLNTEWDDMAEPNDSARSSGVTLLDDALRAQFETVFRSGTFTISKRREAT